MSMGPITKLMSKIPGTPAHQDTIRRKEIMEEVRAKEKEKKDTETLKQLQKTIEDLKATIQMHAQQAGDAHRHGDSAGVDFHKAAIAKAKADQRKSEDRVRRATSARSVVKLTKDEITTRELEGRAQAEVVKLIQNVNPAQANELAANYDLAQRYLDATTPEAPADAGQATEADMAFADSIVTAEINAQLNEQQERVDKISENISRLDIAHKSYARS